MKTKLKYIAKGIRWKNLGIGALIALPVIMIAAQFIYPLGNTMLYANLNGVDFGSLSREDAAKRIDLELKETPLKMYFGDSSEPYRTPKLTELGVKVDSDEAIDQIMYPWWLRLVPTSIWWAHLTTSDEPVEASLSEEKTLAYIESELGEDCKVKPKSALIKAGDSELELVPSEIGGDCESDEVLASILGTKPKFSKDNKVRLPVEEKKPAIDNAEAEAMIDLIEGNLSNGVTIEFEDQAVKFDAKIVRSWLTFDNKGDELTFSVDDKKSSEQLDEKLGGFVAKKAGVVTITTRDFTELSRKGGGDGRALNVDGTGKNIAKYLIGETETAAAATKIVPAQKKYNRSYTSTSVGISALSQHFAESHQGVYGVSLVELSGQVRSGGYNQNRKFTTASTYKVYVAYSTLKRVDKKEFKWSDQIAGGRDLAKCFDDMIVLSDNPCAEALVRTKIGYSAVHADVQALGLTNTSFIDPVSFKTTAGDLTNFMVRLENGTLPISKDSRQRLINAMKRNVYRNGIPAGTPGTVADKVGFLNGLLHDTAIVYGSNGTYVLTILTDGSSWGNIAKLTREIEKLR